MTPGIDPRRSHRGPSARPKSRTPLSRAPRMRGPDPDLHSRLLTVRTESCRGDARPSTWRGEQRGLAIDEYAFDREKAELGRDTAPRGEAPGLAAGGHHPMAGHDDSERVPRERLPYVARRLRGPAQASRNAAVGERGPGRDRARHLVDAPIEFGEILHVERDGVERARLAAEVGDDALDRPRDVGRRRRLARTGKPPPHAGARGGLAFLWQLHASDAPYAPRDTAAPDRRVENGVTACHVGPSAL